ncbi:MAG: VTT domain-containing protein [Dehalococcoidia bacterium]|nr:VTT domain-containing protein [Dehalococcoidia bacterium]
MTEGHWTAGGNAGENVRMYRIWRQAVRPLNWPLQRWAAVGKVSAVVGVMALTGAAAYAWASGMDPRELVALGYPGVFLVAFLSSATVLVPIPGLAAILGAGAIWQPLVVGVIGGLGAAAGEMTGYLVGRAGLSDLTASKGDRWHMADRWLRRFGFWAILVVAAVPNPLFDALGLAAGALLYPARRFWLAAAAGNCIKYTAFALLGSNIGWPIG